MHKQKPLLKGKNTPLKYQGGGWLSKLFAGANKKTQTTPTTSTNAGGPSASGDTTAGINGQDTTGMNWNNAISGGVAGLLSGVTGLQGINNSGMNADQKRMMRGDLAVDTLGQAASAFGPVGTAIGAGLGLVNQVGGMLMGTPKSLKDFRVNDSVAQSTGYSGIASDAQSMAEGADTYKNAGLMGKLFGGKKKLVNNAAISNTQQATLAGVLDTNKQAKNNIGNSLMGVNNINKLYTGNMWGNGSVQYGKQGLKFQVGGIMPFHANAITNTANSLSPKLDYGKFVDGKRQQMTEAEWGYIKPRVIMPTEVGSTVNSTNPIAPFENLIGNRMDKVRQLLGQFRSGQTQPLYQAAPLTTKIANGDGSTWQGGGSGVGVYDPKLNRWNYAAANPVPVQEKGGVLSTITNGEVKTYEQYKKLLGAAAALDFRKINIRKVKKLKPLTDTPSIKSHEKGGVLEPMNVIVDGALHAHKHKLKDVEELSDANITNKGIPVVSQAEGGEITQHAEVERDELILHKALTKRLEALYEEGDLEAMIQAGRILSKELVKNTRDSSNKILKNG